MDNLGGRPSSGWESCPSSADASGAGEAGDEQQSRRRGRPNPCRELSDYRQLSVCAYNLAAAVERRSDKMGARWVVSPEVFNAKIVLELTEKDDEQTANRFVTKAA